MASFSTKNKHSRLLTEAERTFYTQPESAEESLVLLLDAESIEWTEEEKVRFLNLRALAENQKHRHDSAEKLYKEALSLSAACENELFWQTRILVGLSGVLINKRAWVETENALKLASKNIENLKGYPELEARINCRKGYMSFNVGQIEDAVSYFLHVEKIYGGLEELDLEDAYFLTLASTGLGDIYARLNDLAKSAQAIQKSIDLYGQYGFRINLIWHYLNTGRNYQEINEPEKAKIFYEKAIQLNAAGKSMERAQGSACANLASLLIPKGDFEKAIYYLDKAEQLIGEPEQLDDYLNLSIIEISRSRISEALQEDSMIQHLRLSELHAEKSKNKDYLLRITHKIADYFAERKDFERAYIYRTKAAKYGLEAAQEFRDERIQELQIRHDAERRKQEAHVARLKLTGLHLRALRVQMNPHFIFNALNAIQGYINTNRGEEAAVWLARFARLMRKALDLSDLEEVDLADEVDFLDQYLKINKSLRFGDGFTYEVRVDKKLDRLFPSIPAMIVQPFVENAIEHGLRPQRGGHLDVHFAYQDGKTIKCTITDNGVGRYAKKDEIASNHKSKGVNITTERLELLFAEHTKKRPFVSISDRGELTNGQEKGVIAEVFLPIL